MFGSFPPIPSHCIHYVSALWASASIFAGFCLFFDDAIDLGRLEDNPRLWGQASIFGRMAQVDKVGKWVKKTQKPRKPKVRPTTPVHPPPKVAGKLQKLPALCFPLPHKQNFRSCSQNQILAFIPESGQLQQDLGGGFF